MRRFHLVRSEARAFLRLGRASISSEHKAAFHLHAGGCTCALSHATKMEVLSVLLG